MKVLEKIWRGTCSCARILATAFFAIFPRSRRLIIFGAWAGMRYDDNSRVLFEYFLEHHKEYLLARAQ